MLWGTFALGQISKSSPVESHWSNISIMSERMRQRQYLERNGRELIEEVLQIRHLGISQ